MNKIIFTVYRGNTLSRIVANTTAELFRDFSDGACIGRDDILLSEMDRISMACEEHGAVALFRFVDW